MRHLNNGTDHRHSKSRCDQSSPARRTKKLDFYQIYVEWFPREACDDHQEEFVSIHVHLGPIACCTAQHLYDENTRGLFKPEFIGTKTVALGCKTYHCINERSTNNG